MSEIPKKTIKPIFWRYATIEDYRKAAYQVTTYYRVTVKKPPTANEGAVRPDNKSPA